MAELGPSAPLIFSWKGMPDHRDLGKAEQFDLRIASYALAGIEKIGGAIDLSCATDEGNASIMSLQTTFSATSSNAAVLACPSVVLAVIYTFHERPQRVGVGES